MNLLSKCLALYLFAFVPLIATDQVFAQEETVDVQEEAVDPEVQAQIESLLAEEGEKYVAGGEEESGMTFTVTAQVNVNAGVVAEQRDHEFIIEFELTNNGNLEPEVLYAVQLYQVTGSGELLVDEKVYPEVLSLASNTTVQKQITYTAPTFLVGGEYLMRILSSNKKGFEYGGTTLGTYSITDQHKEGELYIDQAECFLVVEGADDTTVHGRLNGVDINPSEDSLLLRCNGVTLTDESVKAQFTFRERSSFGDVISKATVPFGDITFSDEEGNEGMYMKVPVLSKPQSYFTAMTLVTSEEVPISNEVTFRYVVQGDSATIKNISLDKSSYKAGEEAKVKVIVSGLADVFPEARGRDSNTFDFEGNPVADFQVRFQIANKGGEVCSEEVTKTLPAYGGEIYDVSIPITSNCEQPTISAEVVNVQGAVLSEATFDVAMPDEQTSDANTAEANTSLLEKIVLSVSIILLLGVVGMYLLHNFKKTPQVPLAILFIVIGIGFAGVPEEASADSFFISFFPNHPIFYTGWYQLADSSVNCGDSITGESKINLSACDNLELSTKMYTDGTEVYSDYHYNTYCHTSGSCGNWSIDSGWRSRNVGSKTSSGSVGFDFRIQRIHNLKGFTDVKSKSAGYSVGACINFTANVGTPSSCVRSGVTSATVAVSITNPSVSVAQYGFKCGGEVWVWKTSNTHTCTFSYAGIYDIQTGIKNPAGAVNPLLTKHNSVTVYECPCATPTSYLKVNDQEGTVTVNQGDNYTVKWSLSNPGESYTCTLTKPLEATIVGSQTGTALVGSRMDAINTLRNMSNASTNYTYTFSCTGVGTCAPISKTLNVQVNAAEFKVSATPDGTTYEVGDEVTWHAEPSGGYPPYSTTYTWSGAVTGSAQTILKRYGILGIKNATVISRDYAGQTASDGAQAVIKDSRIPQ